jgi:hypothetical protein
LNRALCLAEFANPVKNLRRLDTYRLKLVPKALAFSNLLEILHLSGAFRDSSYRFHPAVISVKKCIPAALTDFDQEW